MHRQRLQRKLKGTPIVGHKKVLKRQLLKRKEIAEVKVKVDRQDLKKQTDNNSIEHVRDHPDELTLDWFENVDADGIFPLPSKAPLVRQIDRQAITNFGQTELSEISETDSDVHILFDCSDEEQEFPPNIKAPSTSTPLRNRTLITSAPVINQTDVIEIHDYDDDRSIELSLQAPELAISPEIQNTSQKRIGMVQLALNEDQEDEEIFIDIQIRRPPVLPKSPKVFWWCAERIRDHDEPQDYPIDPMELFF